jgi:hypothetical protein
MTWLPYMLAAALALMIALGFGLLSLVGFDAFMWRGVGAGVTAGLCLMVFSWFTTLKSLKAGSRGNALGHALGGFMLRLVVLVAGFGLMAYTGWGNAVGFSIAFLLTVMAYLALQITVASKSMDKPVAKPDLDAEKKPATA